MRILLVIGCLFFGVLSTTAQPANYDTAYRPDIYPLLAEIYRSEKQSRKDIVFLGNSISFWGLFNETLGSKFIQNRGIPGDHTFGILDRLDDIVNGRPAKIFLLIGINDIARNFPDSVIIRNYERIVAQIRSGSPRTKLYLQAILPTNAGFKKLADHYNKNDRIKTINAAIERIAKKHNAAFIDLYSVFIDADENLSEEFTFDGVHLNKKGYDKWIALIKNKRFI